MERAEIVRIFSKIIFSGLVVVSVAGCKDVREAEWMSYKETKCEPWAEQRTTEYTHYSKEKLLKEYFKEIGVKVYIIELSWLGEPGEISDFTSCNSSSGTIIEGRVRKDDIEVLEELGFKLGRY